MKISPLEKERERKILIKRCHVCDHVWESYQEGKCCPSCQKSFLPANYFQKVKGTKTNDYDFLFAQSDELEEKDLIKGIAVLW